MKLPNGMVVNDNHGRPRYVDRHFLQAKRDGTRRQRKAHANLLRIIKRYGLKP